MGTLIPVFLFAHSVLQENETTDVPMDYAEEFKDLGYKIKFFREDFNRYLKDEGKRLTERVAELQEKLKIAEETARQCVLSNLLSFISRINDLFSTLDARK